MVVVVVVVYMHVFEVGACGNAGCIQMWWQAIYKNARLCAGFLALAYQNPVTTMPVFSSDA